jgi:hypothetical protein
MSGGDAEVVALASGTRPRRPKQGGVVGDDTPGRRGNRGGTAGHHHRSSKHSVAELAERLPPTRRGEGLPEHQGHRSRSWGHTSKSGEGRSGGDDWRLTTKAVARVRIT